MLKLFGKLHRSESDKATFLRFALVGLTISVIDAGLLYLSLGLGVNAYIGRIFSLAAAIGAGYVLNRYFTFHHVEVNRALWQSVLRHYSVQSTGGALNIGIYALVLLIGQQMGAEVSMATTLPLLAVWIGGMAGMCFNFFFSKKLVFDA
ncbi:GtrA family protein [Coraliomargarita parva]|uniref:GtrA family protein n=1 Tax=Coraliomargarita parva TaxID=3014050 RepID=UPI0022B51485|nr:GtrA family protein [Coraliomargarita parva]